MKKYFAGIILGTFVLGLLFVGPAFSQTIELKFAHFMPQTMSN